jgi:hypothetical protein
MMELEFREARLPNIVATSEARAPISRSWSTGYVPKARSIWLVAPSDPSLRAYSRHHISMPPNFKWRRNITIRIQPDRLDHVFSMFCQRPWTTPMEG